jgi:hypothetical protein
MTEFPVDISVAFLLTTLSITFLSFVDLLELVIDDI